MIKQPYILIACANYNEYERVNAFLESIINSILNANREVKIDVIVSDNSNPQHNIRRFANDTFRLFHIRNNTNLGYIGGIVHALKIIRKKISDYDFFIVSNVDLTLSRNFFDILINMKLTDDVGWIAPCIWSEKENRDRNPKILVRPSLMKMKLTSVMYKYPILYFIYAKLVYGRKSFQIPERMKGQKIYAGHGSFMIFTKSFNKANYDFRFPSFLFGEEIFFGELVRKTKLTVIYQPYLIIYDFDHVSTSKLKMSELCKMNYDSIKILTKKYFCNE